MLSDSPTCDGVETDVTGAGGSAGIARRTCQRRYPEAAAAVAAAPARSPSPTVAICLFPDWAAPAASCNEAERDEQRAEKSSRVVDRVG